LLEIVGLVCGSPGGKHWAHFGRAKMRSCAPSSARAHFQVPNLLHSLSPPHLASAAVLFMRRSRRQPGRVNK
jgi:hypothetical protein